MEKPQHQLMDKVKLNSQEIKIFDIIKKAAGKADKPVVMRVAGGWVRDKVV